MWPSDRDEAEAEAERRYTGGRPPEMKILMSEEELLDRIARIWIDSGGDAEGIAWCWRRIQTRIAQLQSEQPLNSDVSQPLAKKEGSYG